MQSLDTSLTEEEFISRIPDFLCRARSISSPGISKFVVSAAGYGVDGSIYLGANLEFPALGLDSCVHAEEFVVSSALNRGGLSLCCLAISAFPCGHCRQILAEVDGSEHLKVYVMQNLQEECCAESAHLDSCLRTESRKKPACAQAQVLGPFSMLDLLPHAFGPLQLGNSHRLLSAQPWSLVLQSPGDADLSSLISLALDFANRSYSVSPLSPPADLSIYTILHAYPEHCSPYPVAPSIQSLLAPPALTPLSTRRRSAGSPTQAARRRWRSARHAAGRLPAHMPSALPSTRPSPRGRCCPSAPRGGARATASDVGCLPFGC
jgi:homodimeric cytidine deaminase